MVSCTLVWCFTRIGGILDEFDLFKSDEGLGAAVLTQQSLIDTQERLGAMLDVMPIGLLIHTEQGILFANRAACQLLHVDPARLLGQHMLDFIRPSDLERVLGQFRGTFKATEETFELEAVIEISERTARLIRLISSRLPWPGNAVIQILMQDITDQKRAENSLRQLTITDELTGAYNRRHAFYEAALYIEGGPDAVDFSVVMVDIDHFKHVNDTYGHAVGDIALKRLTLLANEILPTIEGTDSAIFARIGGEEFVMLLPGLTTAAAAATAELFRKAVERMTIDLPDGKLSFTVSAGVATFAAADKDFAALLSRADQALYEAKGAGRNRVMVAPEAKIIPLRRPSAR
jgi:diguanylate cyclase (GGDEF)-like protein/PAS domain S-box-containing protein